MLLQQAVFGVRGANGVILVTTKQGSSEKPSLSISAEFGMQMPTREIHQVDFLGSCYIEKSSFEKRWFGTSILR